jgi:hypothetical protein
MAGISLSPDLATKQFWENNDRFADLFNAVCFNGRQVVKPELLEERSTEVSASVPLGKHYEHVKQYQDVTKYYRGTELTILGIENQQKIHYGMPLRCRLYDDLDYLKECRTLRGIHKDIKDFANADEFLSGLRKDDRLHCSLRIVIYYGEEPWDGPVSLSDMFHIPEEFKPFFQDYTIPLIVVNDEKNIKVPYKNESVKNMMTQMYLIYQEAWEEIQKQNVYLDRDTAQVLAAVTGNKGIRKVLAGDEMKKNGGAHMCKAMEHLEEQIRQRLIPELKEELIEGVRAEVKEKVKAEVKEEVRAEVTEKVKAEVKAEVTEKVKAEVKAEVTEKVKAEVKAEVTEKVKEEVTRKITQEATRQAEQRMVQIYQTVKKAKKEHPDWDAREIAETYQYDLETVKVYFD